MIEITISPDNFWPKMGAARLIVYIIGRLQASLIQADGVSAAKDYCHAESLVRSHLERRQGLYGASRDGHSMTHYIGRSRRRHRSLGTKILDAFTVRTVTPGVTPSEAARTGLKPMVRTLLLSGLGVGLLFFGVSHFLKKPAPGKVIPAGAYFSATVLTGVSVSVAAGNEQEMLIELNEPLLPLTRCTAVVEGRPQLASERYFAETKRVSCAGDTGSPSQILMRAYLVDNDSKAGIRGELVTRHASEAPVLEIEANRKIGVVVLDYITLPKG